MRIATPILVLFLFGCVAASGDVSLPIDYALNRPTPLAFGMRISPDANDNPIDPPERFSGYHAAVDYEVTAEELDAEVAVYAICSGRVAYSGFAEGYGGLLIQGCRLDGQDVTVLYGHLLRKSLPDEGTTVSSGQRIGTLAAARSVDSDGNRKHLHLGIHRGTALDMRGYVEHEGDLAEYMNPLDVLPHISIVEALPDMLPYWKTGTGAESIGG